MDRRHWKTDKIDEMKEEIGFRNGSPLTYKQNEAGSTDSLDNVP